MDFMELAKKRFSVRKFSDKPVEEGKLQKILEAGMIAPTAKNNQPCRIYVLQSKDALKKIDELTHCRYGAETVLLFTYDAGEEWKNPLEEGIHSGVEDVSIVATHIMLEATELGIGSCWCNYFPNSRLEQLFEIPENEKSVLIMPIGYAASDCIPAEGHTSYKESDDIVRVL